MKEQYQSPVTAASEALGPAVVAEDMGEQLGVNVNVGAMSGVTVRSRRGPAKKSTMWTHVFRWVKDMVTEGRTKRVKKHVSEMLADAFSKPVTATLTDRKYNQRDLFTANRNHE